MRNYRRDTVVGFVSPGTKLLVLGLILSLLAVLLILISLIDGSQLLLLSQQITGIIYWMQYFGMLMLIASIILILCSIIAFLLEPDSSKIRRKVQQALFLSVNGNPLNFREGEFLPSVKCSKYGNGLFRLTISAGACTTETIEKASTSISSALNGKHRRYAVTHHETDLAFNEVTFYLEDVMADRVIVAHSVDDLLSGKPELVRIDQQNYIDLTTSGSMIFAGKTRSGKTTAIISLLLQVLSQGPDDYGSNVCIIDPKKAELSRLPHTYTLDENGEARLILEVMKQTVRNIRMRQDVLNQISETKGDVAHWWEPEANMRVNLLFIDEYIGLRSAFPKKPSGKDDDYCIETFDNLLKIIITQGASTGTYCIISTAEASATEGNFPTVLKSAMSTRVLMRPSAVEARFLWDSTKLDGVNLSMLDSPGWAIFTSTDGLHDASPCRVKFPDMRFPVYAELARLLKEFYA